MQKRKKVKSIVISVTAVVAAAALGLGLWSHFRKSNVAPVKVYDFYSVGMDSYWGDSKETYGPVSTDRIQTVFLSSTQTVSEVLVKEGDTVSAGQVLGTGGSVSCECAEESHLHLEVKQGDSYLDPAACRN